MMNVAHGPCGISSSRTATLRAQFRDCGGVVPHPVHQDRARALQVTPEQDCRPWLTDMQTGHDGAHPAYLPDQFSSQRLDVTHRLTVEIGYLNVDLIQGIEHRQSHTRNRAAADRAHRLKARSALGVFGGKGRLGIVDEVGYRLPVGSG